MQLRQQTEADSAAAEMLQSLPPLLAYQPSLVRNKQNASRCAAKVFLFYQNFVYQPFRGIASDQCQRVTPQRMRLNLSFLRAWQRRRVTQEWHGFI